MGIKSSFMIAARSLTRRKTKNLSAILAIALGVTLLVGIQITTDTLNNAFLTSLLQSEGEVDFYITNSTTGGYLTAADEANITALVPDAVGIMPELTMDAPVLLGSQFDSSVELAGIPTDYPEVFGSFYDWTTGDEMDLDSLLVNNSSILLSSAQAEELGLTKETTLPTNLTTEFTNLTATVLTSSLIQLSDWVINTNYTSASYVVNSTSLNLSLEIEPVNYTGIVTIYTVNCSRLSLSDYAYVNVTATGTDNALVMLGFSMDDGSSFNVANWTDVGTLNSTQFDLTPYANRTLRGDAYLAITSYNGTTASVDISEIAFETSEPIISYTSGIERVDLQVVGIFDSNRPGIGSQYPGIVFKLEHLQQWMSLEDPQQETDIIRAYLVTLKPDHFTSEISKDFLQEKVDAVKAIIPNDAYSVESDRLTLFSVAEIVITLLTTILSVLGLLIMITGVLLISNVQLMSAEDKEFQTGVLRAVGENRRGITLAMLIENMFQGILGGVLGLGGGLAFGQAVALYLISIFRTGEASVQPIVSEQVVILSVLIGVALGVITGILPALRASRVNIVEALRGIKVSFKEKSGRNLILFGIVFTLAGVAVLLINGNIDKSCQSIWVAEGWDTLEEWRTILLGAGLLVSGIGILLSRFISQAKAFNLTAIGLWTAPTILFVVAMGEWIPDTTGLEPYILMIGVAEILLGSVLIVAVNLPPLMNALRRILVKIRGLKGVGQIAPALISSHRTRSTLTFAIFAVILTLNVTVATLVPTNLSSVVATEEDARGVDLVVYLNKAEAQIANTSYTEELYKLDSHITDVIAFKTYSTTTDYMKFISLSDPYSSDFAAETDLLPIGYGEITSEQIRGNATDASDSDWRYDFYLSSFPDNITQPDASDITDEELLDMSREAWDLFFDPSYTMAAYNVSLDELLSEDRELGDVDLTSLSGYSGNELEGVAVLQDENGSVIENPVVFTDSFILPLGVQIWIPMNTSESGLTTYQAFTVAGRLDYERAGGFPLSSFSISSVISEGDIDYIELLGKVYLTEYWANQTNFLAEANGETSISRAPDQYNTFLIKTTYAIDEDTELESLAQKIQEFTNTNDEGYRLLAEDNFYIASTTVLYSKIKLSLDMVERVVSFLQIYVTFGLIIGAVGMAVISIRNVSERKREIGMMRAIGFPRTQVLISVLLELAVLGIIGVAIGIINGLVISVGFASMQGVTIVIPWNDIFTYLGIITFIALVAGAIPGWYASKIPPAEALRYVG